MTGPKPHVTDHAVLRWLERVEGIDVERIRRKLAGHATFGVALGASAVIVGAHKLMLSGDRVTTVLRREWPANPQDRDDGERRR